MCFSASSSFTAAFFLLSIGTLTISKIRDKSQLMFAMIPFLFGIQQATEGVVWLTIANPNSFLNQTSAFIFLIFATVIWPFWVPASIFSFEKGARKILLLILTLLGTIISIYVGYFMIKNGINVKQINYSIFYNIGDISPFLEEISILIYCIPTIIPFFITKMPYAKTAGVSIITSLLIAYFFKRATFGSVWCFFAAVVSVFVLFCLDAMNKDNGNRFTTLKDLV
jgi:hypothetical protein